MGKLSAIPVSTHMLTVLHQCSLKGPEDKQEAKLLLG